MRVIRNTVNTGRTILGTIHQPAEEIFFVSTRITAAWPDNAVHQILPLLTC